MKTRKKIGYSLAVACKEIVAYNAQKILADHGIAYTAAEQVFINELQNTGENQVPAEQLRQCLFSSDLMTEPKAAQKETKAKLNSVQ